MNTQDAIRDELAELLRETGDFLDTSILVNDFEYPVKTGVSKAPYAIFGTGGFTTDGDLITFRIPLTILNRYGVLPYKQAMDAAQVTQQTVIAALSDHYLVLEMTGEEPVELDDEQLGHEFIIQAMLLTAGNRS